MEEFDKKETEELGRDLETVSEVEGQPVALPESPVAESETEKPEIPEATLLTWETEKFVKGGGGKPSNQIGLFAIIGVLVVYAIWQRQLILGILLAAVVIFWFLLQNAKPGNAKVVLTTKGISLDDHFWPYQDLTEFSINKEVYPAALTIRHKSKLFPDLKFHLGGVDPETVRGVLSQYLSYREEKDFRDDLISKIGL